MTRPQPRYQPGERIGGRYLVHQALMGGMGEVYLCLDLEQRYPYALKTFQRRYQSDALRQAFETEVATWVALEKHSNIVRCFNMETLDNQPYMILEWVSGEEGRGSDLRSHLRYGTMPLNQSLKLILDLCYGLQHTQNKQPGLVHRDLKPENILIAQGGLAKITDFGLAQVVAEADLMPDDDPQTKAGQTMVSHKGIAGTPSYMSPEQWRGETLDERTDIYALGCIWYELLTGQPPFQIQMQMPTQLQAWLMAMKEAHQEAAIPDVAGNVPNPIAELINICLAKSPTERPADFTILAERVTVLYTDLVGHVPPPRPQPEIMTAYDYNNRGNTYDALEQYDRALDDYAEAIARDPIYAQAYSNRGSTYNIHHQYELALNDCNQAIVLNPNLPQAYHNRADAYTGLKQYDLALNDYDQAISIDPNLAQTYLNRGLTHKALEQYDLALSDYSQAIAIDLHFAQAYSSRGLVHHALAQYETALNDFNQAIAINPNYAIAYHNRGMTYHTIEQKQLAIEDYTRALDIDPNLPQTHLNIGILLANSNQLQEALSTLEKARQLGHPQASQFIAQVKGRLGQMEQSGSSSSDDPDQRTFDAFNQASSLIEMEQIVSRYPRLAEVDFIAAIEMALIEQVSPEYRPYYEERLQWLRQIVQEQAQ